MDGGRRRYLTDEYEQRLDALADSNPDVSFDEVRRTYRDACAEFEELFRDDAPTAAIRRAAFGKTESVLTK